MQNLEKGQIWKTNPEYAIYTQYILNNSKI